VACGAKTIETRSWKPRASAIGQPLVIHAGLTVPAEEPRILGKWFVGRTASGKPTLEHWSAPYRMDRCLGLPLGAVVASCVLADVVPIHTGPEVATMANVAAHEDRPFPGPAIAINPNDGKLLYWGVGQEYGDDISDQLPFGDFSPGRYAWLLEDVRRVEERCPWCWGRGLVEGTTPNGMSVGLVSCPVCHDEFLRDPIPAKGRQGLWEWETARALLAETEGTA
jgi:hypothetical protein